MPWFRFRMSKVDSLLVLPGLPDPHPDSIGDTPLHQAALYGHTEIVAMLLRARADPNALNKGQPLKDLNPDCDTTLNDNLNDLPSMKVDGRRATPPPEQGSLPPCRALSLARQISASRSKLSDFFQVLVKSIKSSLSVCPNPSIWECIHALRVPEPPPRLLC